MMALRPWKDSYGSSAGAASGVLFIWWYKGSHFLSEFQISPVFVSTRRVRWPRTRGGEPWHLGKREFSWGIPHPFCGKNSRRRP